LLIYIQNKMKIQEQNFSYHKFQHEKLEWVQAWIALNKERLTKTLQEKIENVYCVILVILETSFITYFHVQNSTTIAIYLFAKNVEIEQTRLRSVTDESSFQKCDRTIWILKTIYIHIHTKQNENTRTKLLVSQIPTRKIGMSPSLDCTEDEFHYIFSCSKFDDNRNLLICQKCRNRANSLNCNSLMNSNNLSDSANLLE
jgi:hypothetical protein